MPQTRAFLQNYVSPKPPYLDIQSPQRLLQRLQETEKTKTAKASRFRRHVGFHMHIQPLVNYFVYCACAYLQLLAKVLLAKEAR